MSQITEIIRAYAEGELDLSEAREQMRELEPGKFPTDLTEIPWGNEDDYDVEGTTLEVDLAGTLYDLKTEEVSQFIQSLRGQRFGPRDDPDEVEDEEVEPDGPETEEGSTSAIPIEIAKSDRRKNLVFGWANVAHKDNSTVLDRQGHQLTIEDLEESAYNFVVKGFGTGQQHEGEGFGQLVESAVVTPEKVEAGVFPPERLGHWWVGFRVPPEVADRVESGELPMFSVQGKGLLEPLD